MKKISLAYFGTPYFSADFLEKILADKTLPVEVKLVITQKDKPVGKKQIITPSPVKELGKKAKIPVFFQINQKRSEEIRKIRYQKNSDKSDISDLSGFLMLADDSRTLPNFSEVDLALVCAYGQLIPQELLTLPKYGFWNIHYSLLPKYRGASPVAYALIAGEKKTGVTIFQMDEKIDHGPIIAQEELKIFPHERRPDLEKRLTDLAFNLFKKLVTTNFNQLQLAAQADDLATYTKKLTKEDGFIEISNLKTQNSNLNLKIYNLFRGLYPWPGIWTILPNGKRLKITDMSLINNKIILKKVQLEGKKEVDFETFNRAYKIF